MKPSLIRAVPMGVLGFLFGAGLVIGLRALQSMDPLWSPEIGLIFAGFMSLFFFLWGIGAFNASLGEHHVHEPEGDDVTALVEAHVDHEHEGEEDPHKDREGDTIRIIMGDYLWQISFWLVLLIVVVAIFVVWPNGLAYTTSSNPSATANEVGFLTVDMGNGETLFISQLAAFLGFTVFTLASLIFGAWLMALAFSSLGKQVKEAQAAEPVPFGTAPALAATAGEAPDSADSAVTEEASAGAGMPPVLRNVILPLVRDVIVFLVLYWLFYNALIGWILPTPEIQRVGLSLVNAILFTLLIFHLPQVLRVIGMVSRWTARQLRRLPASLQ